MNLRHERHCSGWPDHIDGRGRVCCPCEHVCRHPQSRRKRLRASLVRVALGERVRRRLSAFWGAR